MSRRAALERFPQMRTKDLCACIVYYDGGTTAVTSFALPPPLLPTSHHAHEYAPRIRLSPRSGTHDDAAMGLAIALTAAEKGAVVTNYAEVTGLIKHGAPQGAAGEPQITGAVVRDRETGRSINVRAKTVINATGCFTDGVLKLDEPDLKNLVVPSKGLHVMLPGYFTPPYVSVTQYLARNSRSAKCLWRHAPTPFLQFNR